MVSVEAPDESQICHQSLCDLVDSQASMAVPEFPEDPYDPHDVLGMSVHVNTADSSCSGDFPFKFPPCSCELSLGLSLCR